MLEIRYNISEKQTFSFVLRGLDPKTIELMMTQNIEDYTTKLR